MQNNTIAIDARPLAREMSGIRRYTEELLKILVKNENIRWLLYTDRELATDLALDGRENIEIYVIPCRRGAKVLWPLYSMAWLYRHKPSIYWSPRHHLPISAPKDTISYLTIHDLVWMESRDTMPVTAYASEWLWTRRSIRKANVILAVSNTTSRKIKEHFKSCKAPIFTITNGYNPPELAIRPESLKSLSIGDYFLAVGTHEPRKNYATLIAAYRRYLDLGGKKALLIVGNKGWGVDLEQLIQAAGKARYKVVVLDGVSDYELRWCYECASALVSASLNEGFGIPLVEAQWFGLPLIVSDIEPYREIAGSEAVFFDPLSQEELTEALLESDRVIKSPERISNVRRYSWEASASKITKLFLKSIYNPIVPSDNK